MLLGISIILLIGLAGIGISSSYNYYRDLEKFRKALGDGAYEQIVREK